MWTNFFKFLSNNTNLCMSFVFSFWLKIIIKNFKCFYIIPLWVCICYILFNSFIRNLSIRIIVVLYIACSLNLKSCGSSITSFYKISSGVIRSSTSKSNKNALWNCMIMFKSCNSLITCVVCYIKSIRWFFEIEEWILKTSLNYNIYFLNKENVRYVVRQKN